jgi:Meiotically up-regulated gene 113
VANDDLSDDELLAALGASPEPKSKKSRTPREARIIAGFEDIQKFFTEHGRLPQHGADRDIFERIYATRLDALRAQSECRAVLAELDTYGWLDNVESAALEDEIDDDALLAALGADSAEPGDDISTLKHVRTREEINAAEEVARRAPCRDFDKFKPLFEQVRKDLDSGTRETRVFERKSEIDSGRYFILGGQIAYVAEKDTEYTNNQGMRDARLRVIFDNGTESNLLMRSMQRALNSENEGGGRTGRRITEPVAGPLFANVADVSDKDSGTIYVLRSLSEHPDIQPNRKLLHKIGVTGNDVEARIANAKLDATFLLAEVEVVATYKLYNINRTKLENLLHRFFSPARMDIEIADRFGNPVKPREWFLVPLAAIEDAVDKIQAGTISEYWYNPQTARLEARAEEALDWPLNQYERMFPDAIGFHIVTALDLNELIQQMRVAIQRGSPLTKQELDEIGVVYEGNGDPPGVLY